MFLMPSVSGSLLPDLLPRDDTPARALGAGLEQPSVVMVETVTVPSKRRRTLRGEGVTEDEVAAVLDHERIQAYRRRSVGDMMDSSRNALDEQDASPVAAAAPLITQAPELPPCLSGRNSLGRRQNDAQISQLRQQLDQVSSQSRSVSQDLQSAQNQVRQAQDQVRQAQDQARQASDQSRQASDQARQAQESARQSSDQARQAQDQARQAQDQARQASDSASAAQRSADSAVSIAQASISSSAAAQIADNLASATSSAAASAAGIIAAARQSASQIMEQAASQVSVARADATLARAEASTQISQAQGAAVSITQATLAVVGTFIGSSILSILAFYLILRYRRKRMGKDEKKRPEISYPHSFRKEASGLGAAYDSTDILVSRDGYNDNGFPVETKEQPYKSGVGGGGAGGGGGGGGGGDKVGYTPQRSSSNYGEATLVSNTPGTRFSLFPKKNAQSPGENTDSRKSGPMSGVPPSLDTWLRAGQVSPFGSLAGKPSPAGLPTAPSPAAKRTSNTMWPLGGPGSIVPARKGPVMRPGSKLPLREN